MRALIAIGALALVVAIGAGAATLRGSAVKNVTPRLTIVTLTSASFVPSEPGEAYPAEAKIVTLRPGETFLGIMGRVTQAFNDSAVPASLYIVPDTLAAEGTYFQPRLNPQTPTAAIGGMYPLLTPTDIQGGWTDMTAPFEVGLAPVDLQVYPDVWNGDGTTGAVTYKVLIAPAP